MHLSALTSVSSSLIHFTTLTPSLHLSPSLSFHPPHFPTFTLFNLPTPSSLKPLHKTKIMGLLGNLIGELTGGSNDQQGNHGGGGYNQQPQGNYGGPQQGYGGQQQGYNNSGPQGAPQVPPPWRAVWDDRDGRWLFINEQNGERTFEHPGHSGGYGGGSYNQGPPQAQYGGYEQQQQPKKNHNLAYGAMGAAAGLAGGALLMHEGEEVKQDWEGDKYRAEEGFDRFENRVEDAPEDAARWTGRKVKPF
jgi:hypothetical protein